MVATALSMVLMYMAGVPDQEREDPVAAVLTRPDEARLLTVDARPRSPAATPMTVTALRPQMRKPFTPPPFSGVDGNGYFENVDRAHTKMNRSKLGGMRTAKRLFVGLLVVVAVASACGTRTSDGQPTAAPLSQDDIKFLAGLHSAPLMGSQETQIRAGHNVCRLFPDEGVGRPGASVRR